MRLAAHTAQGTEGIACRLFQVGCAAGPLQPRRNGGWPLRQGWVGRPLDQASGPPGSWPESRRSRVSNGVRLPSQAGPRRQRRIPMRRRFERRRPSFDSLPAAGPASLLSPPSTAVSAAGGYRRYRREDVRAREEESLTGRREIGRGKAGETKEGGGMEGHREGEGECDRGVRGG